MKTTLVTIAAMFVVAWALNESVAPVPDNLLMRNVEALAGPGGGGGNDGDDDFPWNKPQPQLCWTKFYSREERPTDTEYMICGDKPWMGGGPSRSFMTECLIAIRLQPDPHTLNQCMNKKLPD